MTSLLFALAPIQSWGLVDILIFIVILAAIAGVVYLALGYFGIGIPPVFIKIFWICLVAFVAIMAIRFLASL